MKAYGANKATEFSRKQIGVIFASAKRGDLKVEKWIMSDFYNMADYYGYDDNHEIERCESHVLEILDAVFGKDMEKAQELIDSYTENEFKALGKKAQAKADRRMVA